MIGAALLFAALIAPPVSAALCLYEDPEGRRHYSNVAPEQGWKLIRCTDPEKEYAEREAKLRAAKAKVKIGMTRAEMERADPLFRYPTHSRSTETAAGIDQ